MREESELVTGEAVVLDLHVAKLASRGLAMALDVLVQFALLFGALFVITLAVPPDDEALALTLLLVLLVLVMVGYPVIFETLSRGRSLGKLAVGLRVVRVDGGPIRFRHALTRGLAGFVVDFWALGLFGAVAVVVSLCSSNGRRVGDFLAGTLVVRDRVPETADHTAIAMPPWLAGWASHLDLTRLPDDLALASRQFLARFAQLSPEASHALGRRLAQQVADRLGTPVPPGVPPWAFLAAVLAERRNRDHARAFPAPAWQPPFASSPSFPSVPPPQPGFPPPGFSPGLPAPPPGWQRQPGNDQAPTQPGPALGHPGPVFTHPGPVPAPASAPVPAAAPVPAVAPVPQVPSSGTPAENPFTPPS